MNPWSTRVNVMILRSCGATLNSTGLILFVTNRRTQTSIYLNLSLFLCTLSRTQSFHQKSSLKDLLIRCTTVDSIIRTCWLINNNLGAFPTLLQTRSHYTRRMSGITERSEWWKSWQGKKKSQKWLKSDRRKKKKRRSLKRSRRSKRGTRVFQCNRLSGGLLASDRSRGGASSNSFPPRL